MAKLIDGRWAALSLALIVASVALAIAAGMYPIFPGDALIAERVRGLGRAFEPAGAVLNDFDLPLAALLLSLATALLWQRRHFDAVGIVLVAAASRAGMQPLKAVVGRPRPDGDFAVLDVGLGSSFPSGHTMTAAVVCGLWFLLAPSMVSLRLVPLVRIAAVAGVVLMAISRVWAGAHWPSDTYGAVVWAAAGLAVAFAVRPALARASSRWHRKQPQPASSGISAPLIQPVARDQ